jgi:hypothetical protein
MNRGIRVETDGISVSDSYIILKFPPDVMKQIHKLYFDSDFKVVLKGRIIEKWQNDCQRS